MLQVAQNYRSGELTVLDAPEPGCRPGGVLVRTAYSLISTGTELMKVSEARLSLLGKARARPDQVRKLADSVARQGAMATYRKAMDRLDSYTPLGYSLCGTVIEVGEGVEGIREGDLVAAAGNEFALHAEVNWVPSNLCVPVPAGVAPEHAAFATVGSIALQGVRRAEPQLGETACVIGLGLVGQLVVRILTGAGVRVVGVDTDAARCRLAEKAGAVTCGAPDEVDRLEQALLEASGGLGADHVLLAAGGDTNGPVELAVRLARDRARVVDIGKTRLDLPWNDYYEKELDLRFSRSYGPGRYDDRYELDGIDYPPAYVRWTERRNLACFLDLVADGTVDLTPLVAGVHPIDQAPTVYERLRTGDLSGIGFLFEYPAADSHAEPAAPRTEPAAPTAPPRAAVRPSGARVRLGFVGAGNYATSMLLPHLAADARVELATVATARSLSALNAQRRFGFDTVTTDPEAVLADPSVDAVFVVTRHRSHADYVCAALEHGKAVFVEKPLALTEEELDRVAETVRRTGNERLMVGFNRRFAPLFTGLRQRFGSATGPFSLRYLVNAGSLEAGSWYLDAAREGSRFTGEGGHFIDTVSAWVGEAPVRVFAQQSPGGDHLSVSLRYADGSLAEVSYTTAGHARFPKETLDVTGGGRTARLDNFTSATLWAGRRKRVQRARGGPDKGQQAELAAFVRAVRGGSPMPIGLDSLLDTTRATLAVARSVASGEPVSP